MRNSRSNKKKLVKLRITHFSCIPEIFEIKNLNFIKIFPLKYINIYILSVMRSLTVFLLYTAKKMRSLTVALNKCLIFYDFLQIIIAR